jgi:hypothetical protein
LCRYHRRAHQEHRDDGESVTHTTLQTQFPLCRRFNQ